MLIKPIIGITLDWDGGIYRLNEAYVKAVIDAGGIPVCLPYVEAEDGERIIQAIDGLLLTGGGGCQSHFIWRRTSAAFGEGVDKAG